MKVGDAIRTIVSNYKGGRLHSQIDMITFANRAELKGAVKCFLFLKSNDKFFNSFLVQDKELREILDAIELNIIRPADRKSGNYEPRRSILARLKKEGEASGPDGGEVRPADGERGGNAEPEGSGQDENLETAS